MSYREDQIFLLASQLATRSLQRANASAVRFAARCQSFSQRVADKILSHDDNVTANDHRGVVFRSRYDPLTLVRALLPATRDARGRAIVISTTRAHHLARHRRDRLWSVRAAIAHDTNAVMRHARIRVSLALLAIAALVYLIISNISPESTANWLKLPLALAALLAVGAACSTRLLQPTARTRRRIILSHARCACCLEQLSRDNSRLEVNDVIRCSLCTSAWPIDEVGDADGEHHRCDSCAYDLSGVHEPKCPECGAATGRLRRAA